MTYDRRATRDEDRNTPVRWGPPVKVEESDVRISKCGRFAVIKTNTAGYFRRDQHAYELVFRDERNRLVYFEADTLRSATTLANDTLEDAPLLGPLGVDAETLGKGRPGNGSRWLLADRNDRDDRDENGNTPEDVVAIIEGASKDFLYWYEQAAFALEQYGEALDSLVGVIEGNEYISTRLKAQAQQMIKELASDAKLRQFRETVRKSLDQEAQKRRKAR